MEKQNENQTSTCLHVRRTYTGVIRRTQTRRTPLIASHENTAHPGRRIPSPDVAGKYVPRTRQAFSYEQWNPFNKTSMDSWHRYNYLKHLRN